MPPALPGSPSHRSLGFDLIANRAWRRAYSELSAADRDGELDASGLELLARTAFLLGLEADGASGLARAHTEYAAAGDFEGAARAAFWLGFRLVDREPARGSGWLGRAARVLEEAGCDDCVVHGFLLLTAGIRHVSEGKIDQACVDFERAEAIGRRFHSHELIAFARLGEGRICIQGGRITDGTSLLDEVMVTLADGGVSPENVGVVYCVALEACDEMFDVGRAQEWTEAFGHWCDSQPEIVPNRGDCLVRHTEIMRMRGEWADAIAEAHRACDLLANERTTPAAGAAFYQLAELHRLRGQLAEAEAAYGNASLNGREPQPGLALLRLEQGQTSAALGAIRRALDETRRPGRRATLLRAAVDIAVAVGDPARARTAAEELAAMAQRVGAPLLRAASAHAEGTVLLADGQPRAALPALRNAAATWQELGAPYEVARARALLARAHLALGDNDTARLELAAARQTFERLGAAPDRVRCDAEATRKGGDDTADPATSLTDREVEVLRLIATGRTNRAVAGALGISEKTVARHVSNIFRKLGLSSRAAATAYAHRRGLA